MTKIGNGGPAYPIETTSMPYAPGMSLRDAVALAALQGLCANPNVMSDVGYESHVAARAIAMADAFLVARETGETD